MKLKDFIEKQILQYNIDGGVDVIKDDVKIINQTKLNDLTTDKIVLSVMQDLNNRSKIGINKYGVTLERTDLSLKDFLVHAYEECLDQANYLKRAITELENNE